MAYRKDRADNNHKPAKQRKNVAEVLNEECEGVDPIVEMVRLAQDEETTKRLKFDVWRNIAEFTYPKRKAVQHTGDESQPVKFNFLMNEEGDNEQGNK